MPTLRLPPMLQSPLSLIISVHQDGVGIMDTHATKRQSTVRGAPRSSGRETALGADDQSTQARGASPWLTPVDAATYLGVALGTLRNWTSARYVPHVKRGRVVRYHRDTLDAWLRRGGCPGRTTIADV